MDEKTKTFTEILNTLAIVLSVIAFVFSIASFVLVAINNTTIDSMAREGVAATSSDKTAYLLEEVLDWSAVCGGRVEVVEQGDGSRMVYCYKLVPTPEPTATSISPTETSAYPPPETQPPTQPPYPEPSQIVTEPPYPYPTFFPSYTPPTPVPQITVTPTRTVLATNTPRATNTPNPALTATPTSSCNCASPTPAPPTSTPVSSASIIVDHTSVDLFSRIPDEYISAASDMLILFRHASVGDNISFGLDCLAGNANSLNSIGKRKSACYSGLPEGQDFYDPKYGRGNWMFEFHSPPPGINPEWWMKTSNFIDRIGQFPTNAIDVAGFKMGYVNATNRPVMLCFFDCAVLGDKYKDILDLEALEIARPDIRFMYWTSSLARTPAIELSGFDDRARDYYRTHGKPFFDLADIESHDLSGRECVSSEGIEVICPDYTNEVNGGHLNAQGMQRVAKAFWVFMAQMAGWRP